MKTHWDVTPAAVRRGYARFCQWIRRTPLVPVVHDEYPGLYLKLENLQVTGSFKPRGALNRLMRMSLAARRRGAITASMGNTATGLAYAGRVLHVPAHVVMPKMVTPIKLAATRALGAEVTLIDGLGDDALTAATRMARQKHMTFVHPHRDRDFLTGVASIALEILEDLPRVGTIVVPIGGGGLISAVAMLVKQMKPRVRLVGVQPVGAASFIESRKRGEPVALENIRTIADALILRQTGAYNFDITQELVDDIVAVTDEEICAALQFIHEQTRTLAEPGGAASVAAALLDRVGPKKPVVCIVSGGNIQPSEFVRLVEKR